MKNIKLLFLALVAFFVNYETGYAQKELIFVYIAHDRTTPSACLSERMQTLCDQGERYEGFSYIFYLANEDQPKIVTLNLPSDNRGDFQKLIIEELNDKIAHPVNIGFDTDSIIDIFYQNDFLDETGKLKYETVTFDFYIGEEFWNNGYLESFIAKLYWVMGFDRLKEQEFYWRIWSHNELIKKLPKHTNRDEPLPLYFGPKNLAKINNDSITIDKYSCE